MKCISSIFFLLFIKKNHKIVLKPDLKIYKYQTYSWQGLAMGVPIKVGGAFMLPSMRLTHFYPPLRFRNQVPTFAVRETDVSRHNWGSSGAPLKPVRDDSALRTL